MSEPPHQLFDDFIDWPNVDLLDACYDPMPVGVGFDRWESCPELDTNVLEPATLQAFLDESVEAQHQAQRPGSTGLYEYGIVEQLHAHISRLACLPSGAPEGIQSCLQAPMAMIDGGSVDLEGFPEISNKRDFVCVICNKSFKGRWSLHWHAKDSGHRSHECSAIECDQTFVDREERDAHKRRLHTTGHGRVVTDTPGDCFECRSSLPSKAALRRHAHEQQHQPYACECGKQFSRLDVLNRHLEAFDTSVPQFPCKYCKRHRGADGFRRKDHLMQHIRNYHHHEIDASMDGNAGSNSRLKYTFPVCSHPECPQYRTEAFKKLPRSVQAKDKPFESQSAYTKHMREEHNECAFPCDVLGCNRTGRRGYFREKDLIKHRKDQHPDAPEYRLSERDVLHECTEPGCNMRLGQSSLFCHYAAHDWYRNTINAGDQEKFEQ